MATAARDRAVARLLLDLPGVAAALGLSLRSTQALVYSGRLPSVTIGRSRRVAVSDLVAFVDGLRTNGEAAKDGAVISATRRP
jgi:excisionase family DNA binding protein